MARTKNTNRRGSFGPSGKRRMTVGGKRPPIIGGYSDDERTTGKIRSTPPDLTVVVGSGDNREEFECYKIAMCFACPYFDAMLNASMTENSDNRIEFPDKDPDEWRMFYKIIDPIQIGNPDYHEHTIDGCNAMELAPWFHEFQMDGYLKRCDEILEEEARHRNRVERYHIPFESDVIEIVDRKQSFDYIIKLLGFACVYDLERTKEEAENTIEGLLSSKMLAGTQDLFDISTVKRFTELFLPIAEASEGGGENKTTHYVSQGQSSVLWDMLVREDFESNQLRGLSVEDINNNSMLPMLIKTFIERCALENPKE